jgi:hypothetical protein
MTDEIRVFITKGASDVRLNPMLMSSIKSPTTILQDKPSEKFVLTRRLDLPQLSGA